MYRITVNYPMNVLGAAVRTGIIKGIISDGQSLLSVTGLTAEETLKDAKARIQRSLRSSDNLSAFAAAAGRLGNRDLSNCRSYDAILEALQQPVETAEPAYDQRCRVEDFSSALAIQDRKDHFFGFERRSLARHLVTQAMTGRAQTMVFATRRAGKTNQLNYMLEELKRLANPPPTVTMMMGATDVYFDCDHALGSDFLTVPRTTRLDRMIEVCRSRPVLLLVDEAFQVFREVPDFFIRWRQTADQGHPLSLVIFSYIVEEQALRYQEDRHFHSLQTAEAQRQRQIGEYRSYSLNALARCSLPGMDADDISEMITRYVFGDREVPSFSEGFLKAVQLYTGGNPMAVKQVIRQISGVILYGAPVDLNEEEMGSVLWGSLSARDILKKYPGLFPEGFKHTEILCRVESSNPIPFLIDRALSDPDLGIDDTLIQDPEFFQKFVNHDTPYTALGGSVSSGRDDAFLEWHNHTLGMLESLVLIGLVKKVKKSNGGYRYLFVDIPSLIYVNQERPVSVSREITYSEETIALAKRVLEFTDADKIHILAQNHLILFRMLPAGSSERVQREKFKSVMGFEDEKAESYIEWMKQCEGTVLKPEGLDMNWFAIEEIVVLQKNSYQKTTQRDLFPRDEIIDKVFKNLGMS